MREATKQLRRKAVCLKEGRNDRMRNRRMDTIKGEIKGKGKKEKGRDVGKISNLGTRHFEGTFSLRKKGHI